QLKGDGLLQNTHAPMEWKVHRHRRHVPVALPHIAMVLTERLAFNESVVAKCQTNLDEIEKERGSGVQSCRGWRRMTDGYSAMSLRASSSSRCPGLRHFPGSIAYDRN